MTKTWLITGSANGLGRSIAEAVLDNGDRLVATARRADLLADLQEKYGDKIAVATLDVTNGAAAQAAAVRAVPHILAASVSPSVVGSGSVVRAVVSTPPDVVSVVAHAGGTAIAVPRVGPGRFAGSTTLPPLPPFARGGYAVTFVASDARGVTTQSAVGVTVR